MPDNDTRPKYDAVTLRTQLDYVVGVRNIEVQLMWTRFAAIAAIQTAALAAHGFGVGRLDPTGAKALSALGLTTAVLWLLIVGRGAHWMKYWTTKIAELEKELGGVDVFGKSLDKRRGRWFLSTNAAAMAIAIAFALAWSAVAYVEFRYR